jgi:hypothetical protein
MLIAFIILTVGSILGTIILYHFFVVDKKAHFSFAFAGVLIILLSISPLLYTLYTNHKSSVEMQAVVREFDEKYDGKLISFVSTKASILRYINADGKASIVVKIGKSWLEVK